MKSVSRRWKRTLKEGFTLLELLVVISIIAILSSILLPGLSKARGAAKGAVCSNQLRQINLALQHYARSYEEQVPTARGLSANPLLQIDSFDSGAWYVAHGYKDAGNNPVPFTKTPKELLENWLAKDSKVWICPLVPTNVQAHLAPVADASDPDGPWNYARIGTTYLFNEYTVHLPDPGNPDPAMQNPPGRVHGGTSFDSIKDSSKAITFWDDPCCSRPTLEDWFTLPHDEGVNASYADGHVSWVPVRPKDGWETRATTPGIPNKEDANNWCCSDVNTGKVTLEEGWDR